MNTDGQIKHMNTEVRNVDGGTDSAWLINYDTWLKIKNIVDNAPAAELAAALTPFLIELGPAAPFVAAAAAYGWRALLGVIINHLPHNAQHLSPQDLSTNMIKMISSTIKPGSKEAVDKILNPDIRDPTLQAQWDKLKAIVTAQGGSGMAGLKPSAFVPTDDIWRNPTNYDHINEVPKIQAAYYKKSAESAGDYYRERNYQPNAAFNKVGF